MAREAYRSLYGDLAKLKGASLLDGPVADSANDDALFQLLLAVSAYVDSLCNRHFYPLTETRRFDGTAEAQLAVPDLVSVSSLRSDDDDDGIYETTWADADYELTPQNAAPTAHWGAPHQALRVRSHGAKQQFQRGHSLYETAAVWGYRFHREPSGSLLAAAVSDAAASVQVDSGADFAPGQTIVIESEQLLVTAISSNALQATRGLNGTTAAAHANDSAVDILRWPAPVERAALINAARIWARAPAFEPFYVDVDLDTDVRLLLEPYRRMPG